MCVFAVHCDFLMSDLSLMAPLLGDLILLSGCFWVATLPYVKNSLDWFCPRSNFTLFLAPAYSPFDEVLPFLPVPLSPLILWCFLFLFFFFIYLLIFSTSSSSSSSSSLSANLPFLECLFPLPFWCPFLPWWCPLLPDLLSMSSAVECKASCLCCSMMDESAWTSTVWWWLVAGVFTMFCWAAV